MSTFVYALSGEAMQARDGEGRMGTGAVRTMSVSHSEWVVVLW